MTDKQFAERIREWQRKLDQLRDVQRGKVVLRKIRVKSYRVPAYDVSAHDRYIVDVKPDERRAVLRKHLRLVG